MSAIFLMMGLTAGAAAAWWLVQSSEQARFGARVRELESKLRYSQGETLGLKEQLTVVRTQMAAAEKTLADARANHAAALSGMAASFKRGLLALTTAYFTVGLVFGGTAGWFGASWKLGAGQTGEKARLEMEAGLGELKVELLQKQLNRLEQSSDFFERALREERVARAVALTKLQILLESVYPQKSGDGLALDEQRLKKNLKDKLELETPYQDLPMLHSAPRP